MLGENAHHFRRGIATRLQGNYHNIISPKINAKMNQADLIIANFECSLMADQERETAEMSRGVYAAPVSALSCFDNWQVPLILNLANNHFQQHGRRSAIFTLNCLKKRGINCIGLQRTPLELTIKGKKIFLWGVSFIKDAFGDQYLSSSPASLIGDLEWGEKPNDAIWILSIHWGVEYAAQPNRIQRELALKLAEHGVDLILGHHPHVIQPVVYEGGMPVVYSHGNFIFDQNFSKHTRTGLMAFTEIENKTIKCYKILSKNFHVSFCEEIPLDRLEILCRKKDRFFNPLLMRALMKVEMICHAHEVPAVAWGHFAKQFFRKFIQNS